VIEWYPPAALAEVSQGRCINELHELDCWRAYMHAVARHNEWRKFFFSRRPTPLDPRIRAAAIGNSQEISFRAQSAALLRLEEYDRNMEIYTRSAATTRDAAVEALRFALLYDGGWMRDIEETVAGEDAEADKVKAREARIREVAGVRRAGVPQLIALLHHVLDSSSLHGEAAELASMVADDGLRLYEDFSRSELAAFVRRVAGSTIMIADAAVRTGDAIRPYSGFFFEEGGGAGASVATAPTRSLIE
jgi:Nuclear pore protein 84 / 107